MAPIATDTETRFEEGIRLFNQHNFFEAHEVWEQVWRRIEGEERIFYQGLIQAAAALLHVQRGNNAGAFSVYRKSCTKLANFPVIWRGIELGKFRCDLARYFGVCGKSGYADDQHSQLPTAGRIVGAVAPPTISLASSQVQEGR